MEEEALFKMYVKAYLLDALLKRFPYISFSHLPFCLKEVAQRLSVTTDELKKIVKEIVEEIEKERRLEELEKIVEEEFGEELGC
jgi:MoxR-like ATPase